MIQETKKNIEQSQESLVAVYNNSNEIFGISNGRLLKPKGNARVSADEANMLLKNHKHAIHLEMFNEKDALAKFASEKEELKAKIVRQELAKPENEHPELAAINKEFEGKKKAITDVAQKKIDDLNKKIQERDSDTAEKRRQKENYDEATSIVSRI